MSPIITNKAPECLEKYHNLLCWPLIIFRLCNELGTSKLCSFLFGAKLYFRIYGIIESSSNHTYIDKFSCFIFKICDTGRGGERWNSNFNHVLHAWNKSSEDFAQEHISNLINQTWKKMIKDRVYNFPFEKPFLETAINLSRISRTKLPFALFGQTNQPFAILSKLNREMPLFWKLSFSKSS